MAATWFDFLKQDFLRGFAAFCGFEVDRVGDGEFDTRLTVGMEHRQQDGFVHAGVMATMADHTAGSAATSLIAADEIVLTAEFKVNFMRGTRARELCCRADVLKAGRQLIIAKSEVWDAERGREDLTAIAIVTLAVVKQT